MAQQRCSRRFIDNAEQTKRACPPRESTPADGRSRAANEKKEDAFSSLPPYPASYLFFFPTFNENLKPDAPTGKRFRALWHKNMPVLLFFIVFIVAIIQKIDEYAVPFRHKDKGCFLFVCKSFIKSGEQFTGV